MGRPRRPQRLPSQCFPVVWLVVVPRRLVFLVASVVGRVVVAVVVESRRVGSRMSGFRQVCQLVVECRQASLVMLEGYWSICEV